MTGSILCLVASWGVASRVQWHDVQHDDLFVGMLGIMAVVLGSMLCCAAHCGERYAVQHVEFSDMMHVQHDDVLCGMLDNLLYWAA